MRNCSDTLQTMSSQLHAVEYLEVSLSTFLHYVATGRLSRSSTVGRSQMFKVAELKAFKKALKTAKA